MPSAGKCRGQAARNRWAPTRKMKMTQSSAKPAKADKKDWNKYMDELKKETAECIIENQVP
jgi:hypothetical protein